MAMSTFSKGGFVMASGTLLIIVGRNKENAYRGASLPAYINTDREF